MERVHNPVREGCERGTNEAYFCKSTSLSYLIGLNNDITHITLYFMTPRKNGGKWPAKYQKEEETAEQLLNTTPKEITLLELFNLLER